MRRKLRVGTLLLASGALIPGVPGDDWLCRPCYQGYVYCQGEDPLEAHWHECANPGPGCTLDGSHKGPYDNEEEGCSHIDHEEIYCHNAHTACGGSVASALGYDTPQALFQAIGTMPINELPAVLALADYVSLNETSNSVLVHDCGLERILAERALTPKEYLLVEAGLD